MNLKSHKQKTIAETITKAITKPLNFPSDSFKQNFPKATKKETLPTGCACDRQSINSKPTIFISTTRLSNTRSLYNYHII